MDETRPSGGHDATEVARDRGRQATSEAGQAGAWASASRRRVDWLSIGRTKFLRTSRECLDCWEL